MKNASKITNGMFTIVVFFLITALALLIAVPSRTLAATITVNSTDDTAIAGDGKCTLREAINNANSDTDTTSGDCVAGSGADTITFSVSGTITLSSTLPDITSADGLTIDGGGAVIISGNNAVRVFIVDSGASLTLQNLTVANGMDNSGFGGGGIFNNGGTVTITNSTFSGNSAGNGGGITGAGFVTITNSTFSGNLGGGIAASNIGAPITITNSIVANNPGGNCLNSGDGFTDGDYNIDDGTTCGFSTANNSKPSTNHLLDPAGLKNNGGPTQTIALCAASGTPSGCTGKSPAIDAIPKGTNGCGTTITTDQRGFSRPDPEDNGTLACDTGAVEVQEVPLDCSKAAPSVSTILAPNHKFVPINILGVTDPDGDPITITITSIFQDEPVASDHTCPDATGVGTSTANVRAERDGNGDGRVYHIKFTANDGNGGTCTGEVRVCVPLDPEVSTTCVDEGALYDSTVPTSCK